MLDGYESEDMIGMFLCGIVGFCFIVIFITFIISTVVYSFESMTCIDLVDDIKGTEHWCKN